MRIALEGNQIYIEGFLHSQCKLTLFLLLTSFPIVRKSWTPCKSKFEDRLELACMNWIVEMKMKPMMPNIPAGLWNQQPLWVQMKIWCYSMAQAQLWPCRHNLKITKTLLKVIRWLYVSILVIDSPLSEDNTVMPNNSHRSGDMKIMRWFSKTVMCRNFTVASRYSKR
jgi:hypothetical protein